MDLSDTCVKELQAVVDGEVIRRTAKLKDRLRGVEKDRAKIQQECRDVRNQLEIEQGAVKLAGEMTVRLEQELRETKASEKALKTALVELTPNEKEGVKA